MKGIHKFDLITSVSLSLITFAVLGFFYYTIILYTNATYSDSNLQESIVNKMSQEEKVFTPPIDMKRLVINLPSKTRRLRFLELELSFETLQKNNGNFLEKYGPLIKDVAIGEVGKMTPAELNSLSGKIILEQRLKTKIREKTQKNLISRIFYRRFVVQ